MMNVEFPFEPAGSASDRKILSENFSSRPGVSLVEVLVILLLLLTLAGIGIVYVAQQRENAARAHCANNLMLLGKAIKVYVDRDPLKLLPPARIAEGYATWSVLIGPVLKSDHPLAQWEVGRIYIDQPPAVREARLPEMFCPSRTRPTRLSISGDVCPGNEQNTPGALGDYAGVAGDGRQDRPWTGSLANGSMILGEVIEEKDGLITRWRGRVKFESLKRGLSNTLLLGEKHLPLGGFGQVAQGDGSVYNGRNPEAGARIGGPGFPPASSPTSPFLNNFGSYHPRICPFLLADLSVRPLKTDISETVLGELTLRGD